MFRPPYDKLDQDRLQYLSLCHVNIPIDRDQKNQLDSITTHRFEKLFFDFVGPAADFHKHPLE